MLHIPPTNCLLLTAKQEPYKKAYLLTKNIEEFSGKSLEEMTSRQKNIRQERVTGLGRRTREEIAKWNQMTALRFQTGGRHQISPASLRGQVSRQYRPSNSTKYNDQQQLANTSVPPPKPEQACSNISPGWKSGKHNWKVAGLHILSIHTKFSPPVTQIKNFCTAIATYFKQEWRLDS